MLSSSSPTNRVSCRIALAVLALSLAWASPGQAQPSDIEEVSLDDLLNVQVSAASKYEQDVREAPASVAVISADDIARYGYRTLAEALASVRGLYVTNDLEHRYVGVRGFGRLGDYNNRILIQVDGFTLNDASTGFAYIDERLGIDLEAVERIEVVRGPGSSLYGSGAMFAIVNVVMKDPADLDGLRVTATGGDVWRGSATAGVDAGGVSAALSVLGSHYGGQAMYFPEFDAPETNGGIAERLDWYRQGSARGVISASGLTLAAHYTRLANGSPAAPADRIFNSEETRTFTSLGFLAAEYERALGTNANLTVHSSLNRLLLRHGYHVYSRSKDRLEVDEDELGTWEPNVDAEVVWDVTAKNRLVGGVEYQYARPYYRLYDAGNPLPDIDETFRLQTLSGFLQNEHRLARDLALTLGLRVDQFPHGIRAVAPRAAAVYHLSERGVLKALAGSAFRAPSTYERNFQNPGINIIVNPNLEPEQVRTAELTWEHRWTDALSSAAAVYYYDIDGLIDLAINADEGAIQYQNRGEAHTAGAELEVNLRPGPHHHAYVRYALQRAREADHILTNSPMHVLRVGGYALFGRLSLAPEVHIESGRHTVRGTQTAPHALLDLSAQMRLGYGFQARAYLRNLLDAHYTHPGTYEHRQRALTQPGRTVSLGLSYRP